MGEVKQYWLIEGSEDTCEIVEEADLLESVHDLFCCDEDLESCDNGYFSDFKKSKEDGDKMWSVNLEDGWIQIQKLAALPKPYLALLRVAEQFRDACKEMRFHAHACQKILTTDQEIPLPCNCGFDSARAALAAAAKVMHNG